MGIEKQMEFDFSRGEKLAIAKEFNIVPSEENLANLEKIDGKWYLKGWSVERIEELYKDKDEYWK